MSHLDTEDLIDRRKDFILDCDIEQADSQLSSGTPLPIPDAMDQQLISQLLQSEQEDNNNQNPYHDNSETPLFFSLTHYPNQQDLVQHQSAINAMIAATTGSLFNPFVSFQCEPLAPLQAIISPPAITTMLGNHHQRQSSVSASTGGMSVEKRRRDSAALTPDPEPMRSKKGKISKEITEKVKKEPKPRPINARALALDREVIMLHEIDRPVAERMIRDKLGNNPDTSKSLRRLAMEGKVVRHGAGGRGEPFRYELTELGKEIYRQNKEHVESG